MYILPKAKKEGRKEGKTKIRGRAVMTKSSDVSPTYLFQLEKVKS
jgi:hypothetical protein